MRRGDRLEGAPAVPCGPLAAPGADRGEILARLGVSRETTERLDAFVALLAAWQRRINLVAPSTLPALWTRHILDSAQLLPLGGGRPFWIDLGSGGGFPGLVLAILAEVIGTSALKASEGFSRLLPSVVVIGGYGIAFYFLSLTLRQIPVGIAYAIWSGIGIVLISLIALALFGQKLDAPALIGMALIIAGVVVINLFSKSAAH